METRYALKRKTTFKPPKLLLVLVALIGLAFVSQGQEILWYQLANTTTKVDVTAPVTVQICAEDPMVIGFSGGQSGWTYRLLRNGSTVGALPGLGGYQTFGTFGQEGIYQLQGDQGIGSWTSLGFALTIDHFFVLPDDTTSVFHFGNPADPTFLEHYICQLYSNPVYKLDTIAIQNALIANGSLGIAQNGITWYTIGWNDACTTINLSTTGDGFGQIKVNWFESVRGKIWAEVETVEGCTFTTDVKFVYMFLEAPNDPYFIDENGDQITDTVHICSDDGGEGITLTLNESDYYEVCVPPGQGFPTPIDPQDGYWYYLYEWGLKVDSMLSTPAMGPLVFNTTPSGIFDTILYSVYGVPVHRVGGEAGQPLPYCLTLVEQMWVVKDLAPTADAGVDIVPECGESCYTPVIGMTGVPEVSRAANFDYWWTYSDPLGNQAGLIFTPSMDDSIVEVCIDGQADCPYGAFTLWFNVVNGLCMDSDDAGIAFLESPTADAGEDYSQCAEMMFTLDATPYSYCGVYGINRWDTAFWEDYMVPDAGLVLAFDPNDPGAVVTVTAGDACAYGEYVFVWHEVNSQFGTTCEATDTVIVTIYEQPMADAGEDAMYCNLPYFTLDAVPYTLDYCQDVDNRDVTYLWEYYMGPCTDVDIANPTDPQTRITIQTACACPFGEFYFVFTETNGDCSSTDTVMVTHYEEPSSAITEADFAICESELDETCYTINAQPHAYCQTEGLDVSYMWTQIPTDDGNDECTATFTDPTAASTQFCLDCDCPAGYYGFVFTEYNGTCEFSDTLYVTIYEAPVADAGEDWSMCILASDWTYYSTQPLMGNDYDWCYTGYGYWTKCGGPGMVTFTDASDPMTDVNVDAFGCYTFCWNLENDQCSDVDEVSYCWIEQPIAMSSETMDTADCDALELDMTGYGITKHVYAPAPNVHWEDAHWVVLSTPSGDLADAWFADETDPTSMMYVNYYGYYEVAWVESNNPEFCGGTECMCNDTVFLEAWFYEFPSDLDAGMDETVCGNCYDLMATPHTYLDAPNMNEGWGQWTVVDEGQPCLASVTFADDASPTTEVCFSNCLQCYGPYKFVWTEYNGNCMNSDTVEITFVEAPGPVPLTIEGNDQNCYGGFGIPANRDYQMYNCVWPDDPLVIDACAFTCWNMWVDENCPGMLDDCGNPIPILNPAYTYEWSVVGPAGTEFWPVPGYYNEAGGYWEQYPSLNVCWGECCEEGIIYLTITGPNCDTTFDWNFNIHHTPDAEIAGDELAEVSSIFTYTAPFDSCYLYNWQVEHCGEIVSGQGTHEILVHWTSYNENGGIGEIVVNILDTCTGCCDEGRLDVIVLPQYSLGDGTLSGFVTYDNAAGTPLNGVMVALYNQGVKVFETMSFNDIDGGNGMGYYEFMGINEVTAFDVMTSFDGPWYGANATDALAIQLHVVGTLPITDPLYVEAADVNASGGVTATDALWVMQRAISMVTMFPAGDWAFEPGMTATAGTMDIPTLNYGDVNSSNVPTGSKDMPAFALIKDGTINVKAGEVFELPIRVADAVQLGAITFDLGFNSELIEVVDVTSFDGMISSINDNNVRVAWSNINPVNLFDNDAVVTVKARALGELSSNDDLFSVNLGSEFADAGANVIEEMTLKTFGVSTDVAPAEYALGFNRPNPFSNTTQIEYTLPESGKVRLSVINVLGSEVATLVEATQPAGAYSVTFSASGLTPGVYLYKIVVDGDSKDFVETRRMVISH